MTSIFRIGASIASAILLIFLIYLVAAGTDKAQYITVAVVFVFTVLATRLDDLTNLTFGPTGLNAALEKKLKEAEATVTQLQRVAELFGQIGVEQICMNNSRRAFSSREKRDFIARIEQELKAIGVSEERVKIVLAPQRDFDTYNYYAWVSSMLRAPYPPQNEVVAFTGFYTEFPHAEVGATPSIAEVEAYLTKHGVTEGEQIERLKDWKHYEATGKHRRLELWDRRDDY